MNLAADTPFTSSIGVDAFHYSLSSKALRPSRAVNISTKAISGRKLTSGPLFRPRLGANSRRLSDRPFSPTAMYLLVQSYLEKLPGAVRTDEQGKRHCVYSPHSLRATTATLLLDAGVDIRKVQELLGHKHVTTTQIYDKRRRTVKESASHDMPI